MKNKNKTTNNNSNICPVVGIGASAGGLEAIEGFFTNMASDCGLAFVIVQHMNPNYKSLMSSILEKYTDMKIEVINDGIDISPNTIYLNPPSKNILIKGEKLFLKDFDKSSKLNLPIDYFFKSLAKNRSKSSVGIIFSGTGSDGTEGIKEINKSGGFLMAQKEIQAKYGGMPHSAIMTGLIDVILPTEELPAQLLKYIKDPDKFNLEKNSREDSLENEEIQQILNLVRLSTGHDFSNYKKNTVQRRIARRFIVNQIQTFSEYIDYLKNNPLEINELFKDLLISVTNFFRDPEAYDILSREIKTIINKDLINNSTFRCWVPACATGEEVYSIAILLFENIEKVDKNINIQIFATDIDETAIEFARRGIYPATICEDVSIDRLNKYFIKKGDFYKIKKQIRDLVVFAKQDLIKDPPFSKLDFISCRNLLIYMDQSLQKKILPLFHYILNYNGLLFLGSSESIGNFTDQFQTIDSKWKIFKRQNTIINKWNDAFRFSYQHKNNEYGENLSVDRKKTDIREIAQKIIMEKYCPSFVLIDQDYQILFFSSDIKNYLSLPTGEAVFNILKMVKEEIRYKLSIALKKVVKEREPVIIENVKIGEEGNDNFVNIEIRPFLESKDYPELILVVFNKINKEQSDVINKSISEDMIQNERLSVLQQELQTTKKFLQNTIEDLETANEELKSSNEEIQSTNEELQSTNEELETSKEELQSTNEELITVNTELQTKVDELFQANNDINNLLTSTEIGTLFLDRQLCIKRFTPAINKILNLIQTDISRPLSDLSLNIKYDNLIQDVKEVLNDLVRKEIEIESNNNLWYSMRISPYRTLDNVIDGVVITFIEITALKNVENKLILSEDKFKTAFSKSNDAISLWDAELNLVELNDGEMEFYPSNKAKEDLIGKNISELMPEILKTSSYEKLIDLLKNEEPFTLEGKIPYQKRFERFVVIRGYKLNDGLSISITDVTKNKKVLTKYENTIKELKKQISDLKHNKK